jgi:hypothetical protein
LDIQEIETWVKQLQGLKASISQLASVLRDRYTVRSSRRPPLSIPRGSDWIRFRFLASQLDQPNLGVKSYLQALQSQFFHKLSAPFLYQRWCGLKLLETLGKAGWIPDGDPFIKLLLGGQVNYSKEGLHMSLLIDPRFTRDKAIAGIKSRTFESTPDFVLAHSAPTRSTVFILDPTLHTDTSERHKKAKYLDNLCLTKAQRQFGLSLLPGPQCSWAAAPLSDSVCRIDDPTRSAASGTVPMNPLRFLAGPLAEWVAEFESTLRWNRSFEETKVVDSLTPS